MGFFLSVFVVVVVVVVYLCVHSHVHIYTMHCVDNIPGGGKIKTHSKKGSNSLNWNVLERSEGCVGVIRLAVTAVIWCVFSRYVLSLTADVGNFGTRKTCENPSPLLCF